MTRPRISITVLLSCITVELLSLWCTTVSFSEEQLIVANELDASMRELQRAEVLDSVSLDRAVHFTTPDVTDTVAVPETYQVLVAGQDRLKPVPPKGKPTLIVEALVTSHTEDIATSIALYVTDDEKFPHIVLLLPGGQGLEAVGSYDGSRTRGLRNFQLRPIQIQKALKKKIEKTLR